MSFKQKSREHLEATQAAIQGLQDLYQTRPLKGPDEYTKFQRQVASYHEAIRHGFKFAEVYALLAIAEANGPQVRNVLSSPLPSPYPIDPRP